MRIGVITTTRAEYGLLKSLMNKIKEDADSELILIVTGTHLLQEYGNTVKHIEEDGFFINKKVPVSICTNDAASISRTMGEYFLAFSSVFQELNVDVVVVLGDRYELIPICFCAANAQIPIAHISGGEITEGAIDDAVRHCITKLSYLHFPACDTYRKRIIQLGESPDRVFNVGDPGVENIKTMNLLDEDVLRKKMGIGSNEYFVLVFHPITLDRMSPQMQIQEVLNAIAEFSDEQFIILKSNADAGSVFINEYIENFAKTHKNCKLFASLKIEEFLSLQKYSMGLIGNSSSGIVETPCFGIPTVNIGDRQKGRLMADSIISCRVNCSEIVNAIELAKSVAFRQKAKKTVNPYGSGNTSSEILQIVKESVSNEKTDYKKKFYDCEVELL